MNLYRPILLSVLTLTTSLGVYGQNFDPLAVAAQQDSIHSEVSTLSHPSARQRRNQEQSVIRTPRLGETTITERAKAFSDQLTHNTEAAPWRRIIYRYVDVDSIANTPLFYAARTSQGRMNFFSFLFSLLNEDVIKVYDYEDLGYEDFSEDHLLKFGDFLDRFGIVYEEDSRQTGNKAYKVMPIDVPSALVKGYYLKEEYYYNSMTSDIGVKVQAICPIMTDDITLEGSVRLPLFWVKYEEIQPFLAQRPIMLSPRNNATNATLEDFFRLNLYSGEIVMTLGEDHPEVSPDADATQVKALHRAYNDRIEGELNDFRRSLYGSEVTDLSIVVSNEEDEERIGIDTSVNDEEGRTARGRRAKELKEEKNSSKHSVPKVAKVRSEKIKKSASSASRSVRNRF